MMSKKNPETEENKKSVPTFTKEQIINTKRFAHRKDLLGAMLVDGRMYSLEEVDKLLEKFMNGGKR